MGVVLEKSKSSHKSNQVLRPRHYLRRRHESFLGSTYQTDRKNGDSAMTNDKSIENTSLPNSIIRTISEMYFSVLKDESPLGKKIADFVRVPKPGFWMIEKSSISGRRKEVGNSEAIVRFICFYQK